MHPLYGRLANRPGTHPGLTGFLRASILVASNWHVNSRSLLASSLNVSAAVAPGALQPQWWKTSMPDTVNVKREHFESLIRKMQTFVDTLSPTEQLALSALLSGNPGTEAGQGNFPREAWTSLVDCISNNGGSSKPS
jgi:hypothetical protein